MPLIAAERAQPFIEPSLLAPALRNDLNLRTLETLTTGLTQLELTRTVLYDFDQVEAQALVHLAEQFNVLGDAGWDLADTEAKKRALLKEAIALHCMKGTPYAVKRALELLGVQAQLIEWFQEQPQDLARRWFANVPPRQPYTFLLEALVREQPEGAPALDALRTQQIMRAVNFWKPARSYFSLRLGLGMTSNARLASVFSGTQCLMTQGAMAPLDVLACSRLRSAAVFGGTQLLSSSGSMAPLDVVASSRVRSAAIFSTTQLLCGSGSLQ